ncbi:MAG TPA: PEP-CTERM sorting domain-containing protein [Verrucomicrobiae bacterium]|nr:PEP-CTERM sorting domain-containing protein [Verrucomicrobiae bacterium]
MKQATKAFSLGLVLLVSIFFGNARAFAQTNIYSGGTVLDRSTLDSILAGDGPVTEGFEAFPVPAGLPASIPSVLDNTDPVYGFGSGMVVPGVTFRGALQWNGVGYYGQPSKDIGSGSTLEIDFSTPTPAFGLDLLVFAGYGDDAVVNVYGADDTTLLANVSGLTISDPSSPVFFGYQDAGGIGMVQIEGTYRTWSPLIDNVTFAPVPEPSVSVLVVTGGLLLVSTLVRRQRAVR